MELGRLLLDGAVASIGFSVVVLGLLWVNPRLFLRHAPPAVREIVPPLDAQERKLATFGGLLMVGWVAVYTVFATFRLVAEGSGVGFRDAFLHAWGIALIVNLVDWLIIDWLLFRGMYPEWVVIPGTYHMPDYRRPAAWARDFYGFLVGGVGGALVALPIAWLALWWHR